MSAKRRASSAPKSAPARKATGAKRKNAKSRPGLGRRILKWFLLAVLACFLLGAAAFAYGYASTDVPDPNQDFQTQTTFVYYADGKTELGRFATQNRVSIPLADVPEHVQDAVIAAEDRTFYTNRGIDPKGIVRAAFSNATSESTQGASTITQQYVKVLYLSQERTFTRKAKEAFLSLKIQNQMSKNEILEGYLNTIYFGRGAYGIQAAAQAYFDKDAKDLTVREGAVLASVLNSPGNFDPAEGKESRQRLLGRYQYVLNGMAEMGTLDQAAAEKAARRLPEFPEIEQKDTYGGQRGHMLTMVKRQLRAEGFNDAEIEGGGLRVTTTFTKKAMRAAKKAVREERPGGLRKLHVAVASVDPSNGALRGMFAGQDYLKSQINWATAGGSPGSAFKPFALAAGIKDGFSLRDTFEGNSPYYFPNGDTVVNEGPGDGNDYGSSVSLLTATEESINTAYIDMTVSMDNGPQKILDTAVKLGIPREAPGLKPNSGISLGSATISPIDMANSYGSIANGGRSNDWYVLSRVTSAQGDELYKEPKKPKRAISADIAADTSYALQQVVQHGTGTNALALGRPAAGKTGTATNGNGDVSSSWFVGYTPQLSTAVMYVRGDGNDALNGYMPSYFGADYPTRTWTATMQHALEGTEVLDFPEPVFLDGEAPTSGHEPAPTYTPPPPTPTQTPSKEPTTEEPEPTETPSEEPT
ncbi:MAG TPA: transglycosylase domain-containing protein, partial [Nocardioidaceae bacterium]|nr:transglycosylase domain-containing protein [Nocardioidaceae bacterium]